MRDNVIPRRFLIIEDDEKFSAKLRRHLFDEWVEATVDVHTPHAEQLPDEDFPWSQYDILFLSDELSNVSTADCLHWLARMRAYPFFPVTILMANSKDADLAVKAIKSGADDYLAKDTMSWASIYASVVDAMLYSKSHRAEALRAQRAVLGPQIEGVNIQYKLNQGGFSALYLGVRESDKSQVVVKTLLLDKALDPVEAKRFELEANILKCLDNKYVARLLGAGEVDQSAYIMTEYFSSGSLRDRMQRESLRLQEVLQYTIQLATGLAVIHAKGIVHRDVKPSNVVIRDDGGLAFIDFGIAKEIANPSCLTNAADMLGTPSYMSPEHATGGEVDCRSDIYSLGVIFYEMLSGRKPYQGGTAVAVVYQHKEMPVPRLPFKYQKYQPFLDKMMAKDPADRFQSAKDIVKQLHTMSV